MAFGDSNIGMDAVLPIFGGGMVGRSAARLLTDSPVLRAELVRRATRPGSKYRLLSTTGLAPDLANGSGEGMMSLRVADLLRRNGVGMSYQLANLSPNSYSTIFKTPLEEYGVTLHGSGREQLAQIMRSPAWRSRTVTSANGDPVKVRGLYDVFKNNPDLWRKFRKDVLSGKYEGMQVGRIRDFGVLDPTVFRTPDLISPKSAPKTPKVEFNAFRGFSPEITGWSGRGGLSHAQNLLDTVTPEGRINLGTLAGFEANYNGNSEHIIPGTKLRVDRLSMNPITARLVHNRDRKSLVDFISKLNGGKSGKSLAGKKIVFVTSGSVGPNMSQRLRDIVEAASRHNDVHVLFQTGKNTFSPDFANVVQELKTKHPGLFSIVDRVESSSLNRFINGADAYIPYGGSSTATEAGAHFTPSAFSTDGPLNQGNIDFVRKVRNAAGKDSIGMFDNITTGYARELENFKRIHGRLPRESEIDSFVKGLDGRLRLGGVSEDYKNIVRRLISDPSLAEKAVEQNNATFDKLMTDASNGARYSKDTRNSVRSFLRNARDSNHNMVNTARDVVTALIDRDDQRLMASSRQAFKNLFSSNSRKRGLALRRILSRKGAKGLALRAGNMLFKTPTGRRVGLPLVLLGTIGGGVGGAALAPSKKRGLFKLSEYIERTNMTKNDEARFLVKAAAYEIERRQRLRFVIKQACSMEKDAGAGQVAGRWR